MEHYRCIPLLAEEGRRDSLIEAGAPGWREARARAKRKRDSAQPQEKHEASIEVRQNRGNAGLTTPSAPLRWLRDILLMAQPFLRLRPIGLALRALLCDEGNITRPVLPSNLRLSVCSL